MHRIRHCLFDWGDTLMADIPGQTGPMCDWPEVREMPNARDALRRLSTVVPCHLATNAKDSHENQIREALKRVQLDTLIDRIFCFRVVGFPKPSPEFHECVCKELECDPDFLVMVGDNLESDVRGAQANGLRAIWYNPRGLDVPDDVVAISDLSELPSLLAPKDCGL